MSFFSNLFSRSHRKADSSAANIPHTATQIMASAEELAFLSIIAADNFLNKKDCSYLNKSKHTITDTLIFSCFVIRAVGIMAASNREKAMLFSNSFVSSFNNLSHEKFTLCATYQRDFDERAAFYDRVFAKKTAGEKFPAIVEEFEYIIKTDILQNTFAVFSESSPLPILGFPEDMLCQAEVATYFRSLLAATENFVKTLQSKLK